jgi:hypothetical protein
MEIMTWITESPFRPLVLIVLAQEHDRPVDEFNIARQVGMIHQQMSGEPVETAVIVKQVRDLEREGYVELAQDGFKWQLTDLGLIVGRQWAPGNYEPDDAGPLGFDAIRAWRDRIIAAIDVEVRMARDAGIDASEWLMTQSQRLVEMHVLNRVLGEEKTPESLTRRTIGDEEPPVDIPNE